LTVPFLTNEDGDPIGFILDTEGRYVERPGFELVFDHRTNKATERGLEPGDEVWVEGECVRKVPNLKMQPGPNDARPMLRFDGQQVDVNRFDWGQINSEPKDPTHWVWPGFDTDWPASPPNDEAA
jgi:hypothetical protein